MPVHKFFWNITESSECIEVGDICQLCANEL